MKFLTDENIAPSVVLQLRKAGFDVKDVKEQNLHGLSDKKILELARRENRILLTHDKDFVNLASLQVLKHKGILVIRLQDQKPQNVSQRLLHLFHSSLRRKLPGRLVVLSDTKIVLHTH